MEKRKERILIIDDDPSILTAARMVLKNRFSNIFLSNDPQEIFREFYAGRYDVLLLDMNFKPGEKSGQEGLEWLKKFRQKDSRLSIISITAYGELDIAVEAMKNGAADFITKPWENERLITSVINAAELKSSREDLKRYRERDKFLLSGEELPPELIIGKSAVIRSLYKTIEKVSPTDASVLILGENGTGKELFAREIHRLSLRKNEVFIPIDLGSISESLFESELFGHVKGAFTDARASRTGWMEMAEKGTLFLDEITNIPINLQQKLLSILQSRKVYPVGSKDFRNIDIRLICATNADISALIEKKLFRQDLYYRINTVEIVLPPLRQRQQDIPVIAEFYLHKFARKYQKDVHEISPSTYEKLAEYDWPGNIRELRHILERAVILSEGERLKPGDFPLKQSYHPKFAVTRFDSIEKEAIERALANNNGNYSKAARELGIGRSTLYRKIKKYGI